MSRASRLARRSEAEQRHVEEFVAERLALIRAAGGDERTLPTALLTVGCYLLAGMDSAETVVEELESCARDLRGRSPPAPAGRFFIASHGGAALPPITTPGGGGNRKDFGRDGRPAGASESF